MTAGLELEQLLHLSLGTPEAGAVNFNILHGLIWEILKHLGIDKKTSELEHEDFKSAANYLQSGLLKRQPASSETEQQDKSVVSEEKYEAEQNDSEKEKNTQSERVSSAGSESLREKVARLERKLETLDTLPTNTELIQRFKQPTKAATPVSDMWQFININRRLGGTEAALEKLTGLIDSMMSEVNSLKGLADDVKKLQESVNQMNDRVKSLESNDNAVEKQKLEDLLKQLEDLKKKVGTLPTKEDLDNLDIYVKWPQLEEALNARRSRPPTAKSRGTSPVFRTQTPIPTPPRAMSPHPSEDALEALRQIGELMDSYRNMQDELEQLKEAMPYKANLADLDGLRKGPEVPDDIIQQLKALTDGLDELMKWKDGDALKSIRNMLMNLQGEFEKMKNTIAQLIEQMSGKQRHIDQLYNVAERLQEVKADKEDVQTEIDVKADKQALDSLISRSKFDSSMGILDQSVQDLLRRLGDNEAAIKDAMDQLNSDIDRKLDRGELDPLKSYLEDKIKKNKCKHPEIEPRYESDSAAGMRKPLLRFHCLSCDKPIDVTPGTPIPSIPTGATLPGNKSARPYTTYELDQIRQMQKGTPPDDYAQQITRPCGGSHTVTYPQRRAQRFNPVYYYQEEDPVVPVVTKEEIELLGQDGHIYKGRVENEERLGELPLINQGSLSPRNPQRTKSAQGQRVTSPQPPRTGSPSNRRPRSAGLPTSTQPRDIPPESIEAQ